MEKIINELLEIAENALKSRNECLGCMSLSCGINGFEPSCGHCEIEQQQIEYSKRIKELKERVKL